MAINTTHNSKRSQDGGGHNRRLFDDRMQFKFKIMIGALLLAFAGLFARLVYINSSSGEKYKKQILSQQSYDSRELPYKRGTITDAKGTVLASSELVYNVIIDSYQINQGLNEETGENQYLEPTLTALAEIGCDTDTLRKYIADNPDSRYYIALKNLPYKDKVAFEAQVDDAAEKVANIKASIQELEKARDVDTARLSQLQNQLDTAQEEYQTLSRIQGVWFESSYIRSYPNGTMLSNVLGFAVNNSGSFGLEGYYNDILNGTPGREYGYLNTDSNLERTTIPATDGYNLELTIDANIQSVIEKYLEEFNETYADETRYGANNVGCIVMDVNSGEILGMANYPNYDLSDPDDMSRIVGMPVLADEESEQATDQPMYDEETLKVIYMTQEDVDALDTYEQQSRYLNALWRNYCISAYYEPGSVAKPFTVAAGIESGRMTGDETYYCGGNLVINGVTIKCHNKEGDGILTVAEAVERSCNVALMQMAQQIGIEDFAKFQRIFGFGLKTNIDLADEIRTDSLLRNAEDLDALDLATYSFGQGFSVTMIQMITAFSSLVNGGNYYEPHVVSRITDANGATVRNIEPRLLKKTISESTSEKVREGLVAVVAGANGTGHTARPAGYMIGGKTGTAETIPRGNREYVLSFMGYAPADDPQIAIYVVVDRPNNYPPDDAKYATRIVRKVLTEILPYLGIYMTEPLTEDEEAELAANNIENTLGKGGSDDTPTAIVLNYDSNGDGTMDSVDANGDGVIDTPLDTDGDGITDAVDTDGDGNADLYDTDQDGVADSDQPSSDHKTQVVSDAAKAAQAADAGNTKAGTRYWTSYEVDPTTGYYIDPETGNLVDPDTGYVYSDATMGTGDEAIGTQGADSGTGTTGGDTTTSAGSTTTTDTGADTGNTTTAQ